MNKCNLSINIKIYNNDNVKSRVTCFLALRPKKLSEMFLITIGSLLNSVATECWKVPDFLGIENMGAVDDLKYYYKQLLDADSTLSLTG